MIPELRQRMTTDLRPSDNIPIWQWAEKHCDFSLATNYDCAGLVGPYDSSVAPYARQILDWCQDPSVREIVIRKCSRAGVSESLLMYLRWIVAEHPCPTYYLTADQLLAERFMVSRIKRGWKVCPPAWEYYRRAESTQHDIRFEHMDFRVSWPNAKGAFKQDGWACIIADEFSTWKQHSADMLRKRAGTYRFHKIVMLSSPDPTRKGATPDPVIQEYEATDQNLWTMPDPDSGNPFVWEFGGVGKAHGLKWPSDARDPETGEWDLERVRQEAYYVTPDGTRIENTARQATTAAGEWIPTNEKGPAHVRGCWIVGPMVPFLDGDFGVLAYRFLEAKRKGHDALKSYFFENWADVGNMPNSQSLGDRTLKAREVEYARGQPFFESPDIVVPENPIKALFMTVDVQQQHLWWITRWWMYSGERCETGLLDWGTVANFEDLESLVIEVEPHGVGLDIGYAGRYGEVADFCSNPQMLAIALKGADNMKSDLNLRDDLDPTEGRTSRNKYGYNFSMLTWNTDVFRGKFLAALRGETPFNWYTHRMADPAYVKQVTSTHKVDGEWTRRKGHPNDHLFDCEVMQLALARYDKFIQ